MTLICECEHPRKEHQAGNENYNDKGVRACMFKDCKCKQYHPDKDSRNLKNSLSNSFGIFICIVIIGCILSSILCIFLVNSIIDSSLSNYEIKNKYTLFEKYGNGTLKLNIDNNTKSNNEVIGNSIKGFTTIIIAGIIAYSGMFLSMLGYSTIYESQWRRMVKE